MRLAVSFTLAIFLFAVLAVSVTGQGSQLNARLALNGTGMTETTVSPGTTLAFKAIEESGKDNLWYVWEFDDEVQDSLEDKQEVMREFTEVGTHQVMLTIGVEDEDVVPDSEFHDVVVEPSATELDAKINHNISENPEAGTSVQFSGSKSSGSGLNYQWILNGSTDVQGVTAQDKLDKVGEYTAELQISNEAGSNIAEKTFNVVKSSKPFAEPKKSLEEYLNGENKSKALQGVIKYDENFNGEISPEENQTRAEDNYFNMNSIGANTVFKAANYTYAEDKGDYRELIKIESNPEEVENVRDYKNTEGKIGDTKLMEARTDYLSNELTNQTMRALIVLWSQETNLEDSAEQVYEEEVVGDQIKLSSLWDIVYLGEGSNPEDFNSCGENSVAYYTDDDNRLQVIEATEEDLGPGKYFIYTENNCEIPREGIKFENVNEKDLNGFSFFETTTQLSEQTFNECSNVVLYTHGDSDRLESKLPGQDNIKPGRYFAYTSEPCTIDLT